MRIVKSMTFDAAHYLSEADAPGKPGDAPYARLHGHSFLVEIEISGEPDPAHGWVVDFGDVSTALEGVKEKLDHRLLNEVKGLEKPTLENICQFVACTLQPEYPGLVRVSVSRPSNGETCHFDLA